MRKVRKAVKDKTEKEVFDRYVKAMGAAAATASKMKSKSMKKVFVSRKRATIDDCLLLRIGQQ